MTGRGREGGSDADLMMTFDDKGGGKNGQISDDVIYDNFSDRRTDVMSLPLDNSSF